MLEDFLVSVPPRQRRAWALLAVQGGELRTQQIGVGLSRRRESRMSQRFRRLRASSASGDANSAAIFFSHDASQVSAPSPRSAMTLSSQLSSAESTLLRYSSSSRKTRGRLPAA